MSSLDSLLRVYLHRITKNLAPPSFDEEQLEVLFEELVHVIENDRSNANYNLYDIIQEIQSKLTTNSWNQFQKNLEQLLKYKDENSVAKYLYLLKSLLSNDKETIQQPQNNYDNFERNSYFGSEYQPSIRAQTIDSFENANFDRLSDRRSVYSSALPLKQSRIQSFQELLVPYIQNQITEEDILKYIPYTLAGTNSDILSINGKEINIPENVTNGLSGELHLILELGLLFKELSLFIQEEKLVKNKSQTKVAALSFIQDQLDDYLNLINHLSTNENYSLKSIYADLYDELIELRFLNFISMKLNSLSSYEILSTLHLYSKHGDLTINQCSLKFLKYCVSTFSNAIFTWIFEGEINENFEDFFIINENSNKFLFKYEKTKLPKFFNKDLSLKIYNIGLTNRFLKIYCKETKWLNEFYEKMKFSFQREKLNSKENDISLWNNASTFNLITKLNDEILNYFNDIIYNKNHYFEVINALKDYLLMGKGDFIESLINKGEEVLNEPSNSLSGYQLSNMLRQSVLKTTSRYDLKKDDDNYILKNLDARLLSIGHGNIGWDVFTIDYRINPPLGIILESDNNDFKRDYLRVFNHLWKIKRLDYLYSEMWKETKLFRGCFKDKKFKRFKLVENFFYSFIKSIRSYILNDVIEVEFKKFILKLKNKNESIEFKKNEKNISFIKNTLKPNKEYLKELNGINFNNLKELEFNEFTINEMKSIHNGFLISIIKNKLINGSGKGKISKKPYVNQLNSLINTSFRFILTTKELHSIKYEKVKDINMLTREGNIYDNLLKLFQDFNHDLKIFVNDLNSDDEMELRYLGISLNQ